MKNESDTLMDEIHDNVIRDRKMLVELCDALMKMKDSDPLAAIGIAENIARLSDSLAKANGQLVEIAKLKSKKELLSKPDSKMSEDEVEGLFDEIGDDASTEDENN